jgi:hypothetical protein
MSAHGPDGRTDAAEGVGWEPASLRSRATGPQELIEHWRYVVLEEIVGPTATLVSWRWPLADPRGCLFWPSVGTDADHDTGHDDGLAAVVPLALLRSTLYAANDLVRAPRCGDVFAVQVDAVQVDAVQVERLQGWGDEEPIEDLRVLFPSEVLDISADAHEAVRLMYKASIAPVGSAPPDEDVLTGKARAAAGSGRRRPRTASTAPAPRLRVGKPPAAGTGPPADARPRER